MKLFSTPLLIVAAAIAVGASVRSVGNAADPASPAPAPAASAAADASPGVAPVVDTKNFAYVPATLTVHPGDTVTFKNSDTIAHTVTSADKSFDSGNMDQGATWSHVFKTAGTYSYICSYHTYMQGTIVVK